MLFVELSEVCRNEMRKVVWQPGDNLTRIPHPDEVSDVLKLETAVSGTAMYFVVCVALKVEPFPGPIDLDVAFWVQCTDAGGRALEVTSVDWGAKFVFVAELDFVHASSVSGCNWGSSK